MAGTTRRNHRRRGVRSLAVLGTLVLLVIGTRADAADDATGRIERIELKDEGGSTKVMIMLSRPLAFDVHVLEGDAVKKSVRRLVLDFTPATLGPDATKPIDVTNDLVRQIRPGQFKAQTARIVLDLASDAMHTVDAFESPPHVTIVLADKSTAATPPRGALDAPPPSAALLPSGAPDLSAPPPNPARLPAVAEDPVKPTGAISGAPPEAAKPTAGALSTASSEPTSPPAAPPSTGTTEASKSAPRNIPVRARGRRPYSLLFAR